ncbi:MAG: DUF2062 domain-containing protein [Thermodesulfobacteriota bacterium]
MKKRLSLARIPRFIYLRFLRLRGDPHTLARSLSFGAFVGIIPLMPVQTIILIPLAMLLGLNTIAALIAAAVVSNPLTFVPQYYICWWVGNLIFPGRVSWEQLKNTIHHISQQDLLEAIYSTTHLGFQTLSVILTGGFILGLLLLPVSYFFSLKFFVKVQTARLKKHRLE